MKLGEHPEWQGYKPTYKIQLANKDKQLVKLQQVSEG
jgi:hypothetical protein